MATTFLFKGKIALSPYCLSVPSRFKSWKSLFYQLKLGFQCSSLLLKVYQNVPKRRQDLLWTHLLNSKNQVKQ